ECWSKIEPARRAAWQLDEAWRAAIYLSALRAFEAGWFEKAAERFQAAQPAGVPDHRLEKLRTLSLIRAGQAWLYGPEAHTVDTVMARSPDRASGGHGPETVPQPALVRP